MDVTGVDLTGSKIGDADLQKLKGFTHLKYLKLGDTAVGDAGMESVDRFAELELLGLNRTRISDAGLQSIKGLTQLRRSTSTEPASRMRGCGSDGIETAPEFVPKSDRNHRRWDEIR